MKERLESALEKIPVTAVFICRTNSFTAKIHRKSAACDMTSSEAGSED